MTVSSCIMIGTKFSFNSGPHFDSTLMCLVFLTTERQWMTVVKPVWEYQTPIPTDDWNMFVVNNMFIVSREISIVILSLWALMIHVQIFTGAHSNSYLSLCTCSYFSGAMQPRCKYNRSTELGVKVKNEWSCNSTPPYAFLTRTEGT